MENKQFPEQQLYIYKNNVGDLKQQIQLYAFKRFRFFEEPNNVIGSFNTINIITI